MTHDTCQALIKAIDAYIAKKDDDLSDELKDAGYHRQIAVEQDQEWHFGYGRLAENTAWLLSFGFLEHRRQEPVEQDQKRNLRDGRLVEDQAGLLPVRFVEYGSEVASLLGQPNLTREYIEAEMEFLLNDALCADGRFSGIEDLTMEFEGDEAFFTFTADTTLGKIQMEGATDSV